VRVRATIVPVPYGRVRLARDDSPVQINIGDLFILFFSSFFFLHPVAWVENMEYQVGDRVQSRDEYRATVMYVGSVAGASPEDGWIGLQVKTCACIQLKCNTLMQNYYILSTHTSGTCQVAASTTVTSRECSTSPALRPAAPSYAPTLSFSRLSASRSVIPKMKSSP
jgi:hypothetical protein